MPLCISSNANIILQEGFIRLIHAILILMINKIHVNCYKANTTYKIINDIYVAFKLINKINHDMHALMR